MIVFTIEEKDDFMSELKEFQSEMIERGLKIVPIEFKGGWMLPEEIFEDDRCQKFKERFTKNVKYDKIAKRTVDEEEFLDQVFPLAIANNL